MGVYRGLLIYYLKSYNTLIRNHTAIPTATLNVHKCKSFMMNYCSLNFNFTFFLSGNLPTLANINQQLQKSDLDLFTEYQKISCFSKVFVEPILHNVDIGMQDE